MKINKEGTKGERWIEMDKEGREEGKKEGRKGRKEGRDEERDEGRKSIVCVSINQSIYLMSPKFISISLKTSNELFLREKNDL